MRTAAKIDANQHEIVQALRDAGCSVQILSAVGKGCVDLMVGVRGMTYCLEVKDGRKPPSKRRLTKDEEKWHDEWRGHKAVVESVDEAFAAVGFLAPSWRKLTDQAIEARRDLWERMGEL